MQNIEVRTVGEIALEMPLTTRVFEQYKIDYCCGGKTTFTDACLLAGAETATVAAKIDAIINAHGEEPSALLAKSLTELIDYIESKHHTFTRDEIANLPALMEKVARVHGENHPELVELESLFTELCNELSPHLEKEEVVLFPYVRNLEARAANAGVSCFGTVANPVRMMMEEHDLAGDILRKMRTVSNDYTIPANACSSYNALFSRLEAFEKDLHQHIHLENNLLFPRAVELEEKFAA